MRFRWSGSHFRWTASIKNRTLNLDTGLILSYTMSLTGPLLQDKIHTLRHRKACSRAHIDVLFMCLESEWESLGWITTHPNPLSNNVHCGGRINLFSVFMFFGSCDYSETKLYWSLSFETKSCLEKYQKKKKKNGSISFCFCFSQLLFFLFLKLHASVTA